MLFYWVSMQTRLRRKACQWTNTSLLSIVANYSRNVLQHRPLVAATAVKSITRYHNFDADDVAPRSSTILMGMLLFLFLLCFRRKKLMNLWIIKKFSLPRPEARGRILSLKIALNSPFTTLHFLRNLRMRRIS